MEATVIQAFTDLKADNAIRLVGEVIDADDARIAELEQGGWVKPIAAAPEKPKPVRKPAARTRTRKTAAK